MIERVVGVDVELEREALCDSGVFEERHVPDVQAGSAERVAPGIGASAWTRLDITSRGIDGDVADDVAVGDAITASRGDRYLARGAAWPVIAEEVDDRASVTVAVRIDDGAIACAVAIEVGVSVGQRRYRLAGFGYVGAAPFPAMRELANESVLGADVGQIVNPADCQFVRNVESREPTFVRKIVTVL